jgi:hypothetical protein
MVVGLLIRVVPALRQVALVPDHRDGPWDSTGMHYDWSAH